MYVFVRPTGLEPVAHSLEGCCSIQMSYGRSNQKEHPQIYADTAKETSFFRAAYSCSENFSCRKLTITVNLKSVSEKILRQF